MRFVVAVAVASLVAGSQLNAQAGQIASGPAEHASFDPLTLQPPHLLNEYQVPGLMRFYYPPAFLKHPVNDQVIVTFTVDTLGAPDVSTIEVLKGERAELIAATKAVVAKLKFTPGVVRGEAPQRVPVTVTLPLVWAAK